MSKPLNVTESGGGAVHSRHPTVIKWRNNAIDACAKIADAYGYYDPANDMRKMLTDEPQQPAQGQCDSEPVAWRVPSVMSNNGWDFTTLPERKKNWEVVSESVEPLYTRPLSAVVPEGWRDVRIHGLPEEACELWFVIQTPPSRVVHGAFIDGIFWHSNKKYVALFYMPKPAH